MIQYGKYKATEYEWLGKIPAHWRWLYLSQTCEEQDIKNADNNITDVLSLSYGHIVRKRNINFGLAPKDYGTYQIVGDGNIILRLTDLQNDHKSLRTGLVQERGIITSAYTCLMPFENPAYLQLLLHSYDTQKYFYGLGGGVRQSIGYNDIRYIKVPLPPRDEQDQIVRYLDWKVSQINKIINAKRRQIKLLQEQHLANINSAISLGLAPNISYRDTEIAWMDKIPAAWHTSAIKNHFCIEKRIAGKEGYDVLSITQKGLKVKDILTNEGQMAANYANYQFVYPGDFAMNHMDLLTGYIDISEHLGVTSPDYRVFVLTDSKNCWADYFLRVYQVCYKRRIFYGFGRGAASHGRWRLPKRNFLNFLIPLPPIDEQKMIAKFCNDSENRTLSIVSKYEKEISFLTEYRTRLISDVVTGKVDVRDIVVPKYGAINETANEEISNDETVLGTEE